MTELKTKQEFDAGPKDGEDLPDFNDPKSDPERASTDVEGDPRPSSYTDVEDPDPEGPNEPNPDGDDEIGYFADRRMT